MKWKETLINKLIVLFNENDDWKLIKEDVLKNSGIGVHLAIFNEPFLSAILEERKTIESRFSVNRIDPFRKVYEKDIILIKESGGLIMGFFVAGRTEYWINNKLRLEQIKEKYNDKICASLDENFWQKRATSKYITLIEVKKVFTFNSFNIMKKDRTSWSVIKQANKPTFFNLMQ
ncbi:hypothetical protein [Sediminibacter sp. Hel_I_10]|uniref:hypothetical protein n=1 Tax=Sediminibacter sp. Hel_I_10 TaxID=1392490 RepID=UPI00047A57C0|nr:hypothetical protein [Sediminibacter sp. Hel_I_10]